MTIRSRTFLVTAAALLSLALGACGGGSGGDRPAPQQTLTISATQPFANGASFGAVGAYEQLTGTIKGEVDPKDPRNKIIQDLEFAPANARGMVEYTADFVMLKPRDMSKASGVLRYDAPNRGNVLTIPNPSANPGDAVYLERGYVVLYSAWQGDVPKSNAARLTLQLPVAKNPDGSSITGPYRVEVAPTAATPQMTLPGGAFNGTMMPYLPATLDNTQPGFSLTVRTNETDPRVTVPASDWKFATCDSAANPFPGRADPATICVKGGFQANKLYELIYQAKDPIVMGLGLAALRDTVSFFKTKTADSAGMPNPVAGRITHAIGQGTSQSGNAMKTFLHLGFNVAADGSRVFEGLYAHVAARQTHINTRFSVPGGGAGVRTEHYAFGQTAPRGLDADYFDAVANRRGGVMTRCTATKTCPRFFLGLSGTEFWLLQGSPALTDVLGTTDIAQPANVRIYHYSSTQHGGPGGVNSISWNPAQTTYPRGTVAHFNDTFRALFIALEDWVVRDVTPPDSQVPRIADRTLVRPNELTVPVMRGVTWPVNGVATPIPDFQYRGLFNEYALLDFGPQYRPEDESGIATLLPPVLLGKNYAILVPQLDAGGNTIAGIRSVEVQAPLGSNLEFNYDATPGIVDLALISGAFIPFHKTEATRLAAGDSRPSLETLYGTQQGYVAAVRAAATRLVAQRFLLQRDADRLIQNAIDNPVLP
ncbi:MAG: hypothetical protein K0R58_2895 [Ramlibacter sp.]|nr:hypothetical protein [Ramlibacter sp.]